MYSTKFLPLILLLLLLTTTTTKATETTETPEPEGRQPDLSRCLRKKYFKHSLGCICYMRYLGFLLPFDDDKRKKIFCTGGFNMSLPETRKFCQPFIENNVLNPRKALLALDRFAFNCANGATILMELPDDILPKTMDTTDLTKLLQQLVSPAPENVSKVSTALHKQLESSCIDSLLQILSTNQTPAIRTLSATLLRTHQQIHFANLQQQHLKTILSHLLTITQSEPNHQTRRSIIILCIHLLPLHPSLPTLIDPFVQLLHNSTNPSIRAQAFLFPTSPQILQKALSDPSTELYQAALTSFTKSTQHPTKQLAHLLPTLLSTLTSPTPQQSVLLYESLANLITLPQFPFQHCFHHALNTFKTAQYDTAAPAIEFLVYAHENRLQSIRKHALQNLVVIAACHILITTEEPLVETRAFLAVRLLDAFSTPQIFSLAYNPVISNIANVHAQIGCLRILQAIAEGCATEITLHADNIIMIITASYSQQDTQLAAIDALTAVTHVMDTENFSDQVLDHLAERCLDVVIKALSSPSKQLKKAACVALEPVLNLFRNTPDSHHNTIVDALTELPSSLTVDTLLAVGILSENASERIVNAPKFQHLLRNTVTALVTTTSQDALTTAAGYEAAGMLTSVCKDINIVNRLAEHALSGLYSDEPSVKQGALSFFANLVDAISVSAVPLYSKPVMMVALESVASKDIFVTTDDTGNLTDVEYDQLDGSASVQVRTAYLDEKMVAIGCLGAFGTAVGSDQFIDNIASLPDNATVVLGLLTRASELVDGMTGHFHSEIRASAYRACCRLASANVRIHARDSRLGFCSMAYTDRVMTIVLEGLRDDDDIWVVTDLTNTFSLYVTELPPEMIMDWKVDIIQLLSMLIAGKAPCQTQEAEEGEGEEQVEISDAEIDDLIVGIGDIIEALVRKLRGHFAKHFLPLLDQALKTLYKPTQSGRCRGMVLGTISGILLFMCWQRCPFPPPTLNDPVYQHALKASDDLAAVVIPLAIDAVRYADNRTLQRNAVFLLGVIYKRISAGNNDVWARLPNVLQLLQDILARGKTGNGALVDNAAGALARILTAKEMPHSISCNRAMMLAAALSCVPMEDDPAENTTVARAVLQAAETSFDDLVKGDLMRVLSCLVTAVLVHVETSGNTKSIWVSTADPNDEMVRLSDEEFGRLVQILIRIRQIAGEGVFGRLRLSERDAEVLSGVMK